MKRPVVLLLVSLSLSACGTATVLEHPARGAATLRPDVDACREAEMQRAKAFDPDTQFILQDRVLDCMKEKGYVQRPARWGESATEY